MSQTFSSTPNAIVTMLSCVAVMVTRCASKCTRSIAQNLSCRMVISPASALNVLSRVNTPSAISSARRCDVSRSAFSGSDTPFTATYSGFGAFSGSSQPCPFWWWMPARLTAVICCTPASPIVPRTPIYPLPVRKRLPLSASCAGSKPVRSITVFIRVFLLMFKTSLHAVFMEGNSRLHCAFPATDCRLSGAEISVLCIYPTYSSKSDNFPR